MCDQHSGFEEFLVPGLDLTPGRNQFEAVIENAGQQGVYPASLTYFFRWVLVGSLLALLDLGKGL